MRTRIHTLGSRRPWQAALSAMLAVAVVFASVSPALAAPPSPQLPELVDREIAKSIDRGINYLVKTQRRDGRWLNQGGWGRYPSVMSALSGIALMSGGSTPESGPHAKNVRRAMSYLLKLSEGRDDGQICDESEGQSMYGHGFSMLFLSMCYGTELTKEYEQRLKKALDRAVGLTTRGQSKRGGWTYTPGAGDEGSVTVTQLQALRAARNAGIKVPKEVIDKAVKYIRDCQNADGGISYSYSSRGGSRPAISAAAVACFYAAGLYDRQAGGAGSEAEMVEKLVSYVKGQITPEHGSRYGGYYFYTQLYMCESLYMRGGRDWRNYYPRMAKRLMAMQAPDGSWNGDGIGTTYGTALATIILQLPYNYLPICQR
jgi:hypothetical protein